MIIQFSVENYRSIKEEQTLSLVKNSASEMADNFFNPSAPSTPELLKTAVIYGANASGKSNIIKALACMKEIIVNSNTKPINEVLKIIEPFKFDTKTETEPTTFELVFIVPLPVHGEMKPVRVEYGFSADQQQVYEEWLSVYPKGREQAWFHRLYNDETQKYEWKTSSLLKGNKTIWQESTRKDQLFLSTAVFMNSEQLTPIYKQISSFFIINSHHTISPNATATLCYTHHDSKNLVMSFLQQIGIPLRDMQINKNDNDIHIDFMYPNNKGTLKPIELNEESDGTQKLFAFSSIIFGYMGLGAVLLIDEFDKSLHPDLMRFLVKLFNSKNNIGNGQLIFTTHETSILRKELLRRDQIWFCEKQADFSTTLYPLTDFHPRKDREDIEEAYLHGRYGGKPVISEFIYPKNWK